MELAKKATHLSVTKSDIKLALLEIYLPYVPVLVADHKFEQRLVCIYPVSLAHRIRRETENVLVAFLRGYQ